MKKNKDLIVAKALTAFYTAFLAGLLAVAISMAFDRCNNAEDRPTVWPNHSEIK